jgi:hypothetical protein
MVELLFKELDEYRANGDATATNGIPYSLSVSATSARRDTYIPNLVSVCGEMFTQTPLAMNLNLQPQTLRTALQDLLFFRTRLNPL